MVPAQPRQLVGVDALADPARRAARPRRRAWQSTPVTSTMHMSMVMAPATGSAGRRRAPRPCRSCAACSRRRSRSAPSRCVDGAAARHRPPYDTCVAGGQLAQRHDARLRAHRRQKARVRRAPRTANSRRAPGPGERDRSAPRRSAACAAELATCVSGSRQAGRRDAPAAPPRSAPAAPSIGAASSASADARCEQSPVSSTAGVAFSVAENAVERARRARPGATSRCRSSGARRRVRPPSRPRRARTSRRRPRRRRPASAGRR